MTRPEAQAPWESTAGDRALCAGVRSCGLVGEGRLAVVCHQMCGGRHAWAVATPPTQGRHKVSKQIEMKSDPTEVPLIMLGRPGSR